MIHATFATLLFGLIILIAIFKGWKVGLALALIWLAVFVDFWAAFWGAVLWFIIAAAFSKWPE